MLLLYGGLSFDDIRAVTTTLKMNHNIFCWLHPSQYRDEIIKLAESDIVTYASTLNPIIIHELLFCGLDDSKVKYIEVASHFKTKKLLQFDNTIESWKMKIFADMSFIGDTEIDYRRYMRNFIERK